MADILGSCLFELTQMVNVLKPCDCSIKKYVYDVILAMNKVERPPIKQGGGNA